MVPQLLAAHPELLAAHSGCGATENFYNWKKKCDQSADIRSGTTTEAWCRE